MESAEKGIGKSWLTSREPRSAGLVGEEAWPGPGSGFSACEFRAEMGLSLQP